MKKESTLVVLVSAISFGKRAFAYHRAINAAALTLRGFFNRRGVYAAIVSAFLFVIQHHPQAQTSPGNFSSVSTFNCVSLYWSPSGGSSAVEAFVRYRRKGDAVWMNAQSLVYCVAENNRQAEYRGSIVNLKPGTTYEVELDLAGPTPPERYEFTTWSERFPIAQVITVTDQTTPLELANLQGSPSGYILVTGPATVDVG
jgi:hypothetical protein